LKDSRFDLESKASFIDISNIASFTDLPTPGKEKSGDPGKNLEIVQKIPRSNLLTVYLNVTLV